MQPGSLYVIAGPIGNLEDITYRAVTLLQKVDLIISEDTRETAKLLKHYSIEKKQISYREQNHNKIYESILAMLNSGASIALVSDSGTPLISDPGFDLVKQLHLEGVTIKPIPGPSALTSAMSVSGLPTDKIAFLGFLPRKPVKRKKIIASYGELDCTLAIFESPYRISRLLTEIEETLGNRVVCIAREMTKKFESIVTCPISELTSGEIPLKEKGEFVVMIAKQGFEYGKL